LQELRVNLPQRRSRTGTLSAVTIIVTLLLCPALTRVVCMQPIGQATDRSYVPSFQRSLDVPPKPMVLAPDTHLVFFAIVIVDVQPRHAPGWREHREDHQPTAVFLPRSCSLRAPPIV
jgi:hypothetical protein